MTDTTKLERPEHFAETPVPPIPEVDPNQPDKASVEYSQHRTRLSTHRTRLSEHRTQLSEFRTDLSGNRTEMSMRRTGMSFQRTRMSAERTLMSVIRTSLSLIGFGFTIFQFFSKLQDSNVMAAGAAPRNFGFALVALGIAMLVLGIVYHVMFMVGLRTVRIQMTQEGRIHGQSGFPSSLTLVTALALLAIGIVAIVFMMK